MTNSSRSGLPLVKEFEGCKLTAYLDSVHVPTIGYGHTAGVHIGQTITQAQADAWLGAEYDQFEAGVRKLVTVPLSGNQAGALTSFTYNSGLEALHGSTLLHKLNASDYRGAAACFVSWDRAGGQVLPGLVTRRAAEARLFSTP